MKLVPFSAQYLRLNEPMPFGIRDASGRLLLGAGKVIDNQASLEEVIKQPLFADESESADWNRRLAAAMDQMLRQGASLKDVAAARPDVQARERTEVAALSLAEQWLDLVGQLDATLRDVRAGTDWRARLFSVHVRARQLMEKRPDGSLYYLVFEAGHSTVKYSCSHALLTMLICEQAAPLWDGTRPGSTAWAAPPWRFRSPVRPAGAG